MKNPTLPIRLDAATTKPAAVERNPAFRLIKAYLDPNTRSVVIRGPGNPTDLIDVYVMGYMLNIDSNIGLRVLTRDEYTQFTRLIVRAVHNYNAMAQPDTAQDATATRLARMLQNWEGL